MKMDLSIAVDLCKRFEGFRPSPYLCPAGVPTIGYGSTYYTDGRKVLLSDSSITEEKAEALLLGELENNYAPSVIKLCPGLLPYAILHNDWRKLCAIVDFAYNLGAGNLEKSTLRLKINAQDWEGAKSELMKWVRGGGKVLPGLVARRKAEAELL